MSKNRLEIFSYQQLHLLNTTYEKNNMQITEENKKMVLSIISEMGTALEKKGLWFDSPEFARESVLTVLNQAMTLGLNIHMKHCYLIVQKIGQKYHIVYSVYGEGWEHLFLTRGRGVKDFKRYDIREGDKFVPSRLENGKMIEPQIEPNPFNQDKKIVLVVYQVFKKDGSVEWLYANRNQVKVSVIAQFKNKCNGISEKDRIEVQKIMDDIYLTETLDEALNKYRYKTIDVIQYNKKATISIIGDTYNDLHTREQMILTKMKKIALDKYPKTMSNEIEAHAYNNLDIDEKDVFESESPISYVENKKIEHEKDIEENANKQFISDKDIHKKEVISDKVDNLNVVDYTEKEKEKDTGEYIEKEEIEKEEETPEYVKTFEKYNHDKIATKEEEEKTVEETDNDNDDYPDFDDLINS